MERSPFSFRQRAGRLDWKQISSLDMDDVIINVKVNDLQTLLDSVTFSEILPIDIKSNSIDNVAKCIQSMQLIIEYLLNHQENQYQLLRKVNTKLEKAKQDKEKYKRTIVGLQEEVKTLKKQIHLLRNSIQGGPHGPIIEGEYLMHYKHPPKIIKPDMENQGGNSINSREIMKTLLDHEHESRKLMMTLLEEQRRTFSNELSRMMDQFQYCNQLQMRSQFPNQQQQQSESSSGVSEYREMLNNLKLQLEQSIQQQLHAQQQQLEKFTSSFPNNTASSSTAPKRNCSVSSSTTDIQQALESAAREQLEKDLHSKLSSLEEQEETLRQREQALQMSESRLRLDGNHANTQLRQQLAMRRWYFILLSRNKFKKIQAFKKWMQHVIAYRNRKFQEEQGKQLLYIHEKKTDVEQSLERQLKQEKQKFFLLESKLKLITIDCDEAKAQLQHYQEVIDTKSQIEHDYLTKLQIEKDNHLRTNIKLTTTMQQCDSEKQALLERLQDAEKIIQQQAEVLESVRNTKAGIHHQDRSVLTSLEFFPSSLNRSITTGEEIGVGTSMIFSSLPSLEKDKDEETLMKDAMERIMSRNKKESVEKLAAATLAQEFLSKLSQK